MDSQLQQQINNLYYPPTHEYTLNNLIPHGDLLKRVKVINDNFPSFFSSGKLLDIGCNKGFFSLYHQGSVVGIDPEEKCIDLCKAIFKERKNKIFINSSFLNFKSEEKFDKIALLNGPHYPFIESEGWDFVNKLGKLSEGLILTEGFLNMNERDAIRCIPSHLTSLFTKENMLNAFKKHFRLINLIPSPLIHRFFLLFEKLDYLYFATMEEYSGYLKIIYNEAKEFSFGIIVEVCVRHDRGFLGKQILPHNEYIMVDKNPKRQGLNIDVLKEDVPKCDVLISTAILHHIPESQHHLLFKNFSKNVGKYLMFSGPNEKRLDLFGDHVYHINEERLIKMASEYNWKLKKCKEVGLSKPLSELFMVFEK